MVVEEHFVTRRPILFLIIVIVGLIIIYLPAKYAVDTLVQDVETVTLNETYDDAWKWFAPDSPLNADEKKELFDIKYRGNIVEWQGELVECKDLEGVWSLRMKHRDLDGFADVVFVTEQNCTAYQHGLMIRYQMELTDLKVNVFVGKDGVIVA